MNIYYICKFIHHPGLMKIGITTLSDNTRIKTHLKNWGEITADSLWFKLPSRQHLYQLERALKNIYKKSRDKNSILLQNGDGYTEFISTDHFENVKKFISNYMCIDENEDYLPIEGPFSFDMMEQKEPEHDDITNIMIDLGKHIKNLRLQDNISQTDLSSTLNISIPTLRKLESGSSVTMETMLSVLLYFDKLDWIDKISDKNVSSYVYDNCRVRQSKG